MSYHEDSHGRRRHYNGHRFTSQGILDLCRPSSPEDSFDDRIAARKALSQLRAQITETAYLAWWERCFEQDGHTANDFTWRQIHAAAQVAIDHPETLECSCNGVTPPCVVCQSIAHVSNVSEFGD